MDKGGEELQSIDFGRVMPWVHLFRAFRIAMDVRCLILGTVALLLLAAGYRGSELLPFAQGTTRFQETTPWPWQIADDFTQNATALIAGDEPGQSVLSRLARLAVAVMLPLAMYLEPAKVLLETGTTWSDVAMAWTRVLWALAVWAVFGGAITRVAAVQFARDERLATRALFQLTGGKLLSYFAAPLLPLAAVGLFRAIALLGGLIGLIPYVGDILVGGFWILAILLGLVLALVVIGGVAGWPLMYATISVENSDAFDGFSRSYSYVYSRPWQYLSCALVAVVYGVFAVALVALVILLAVYLAGWSVSAAMPGDRLARLFAAAPDMFRWRMDVAAAGSNEPFPVVAAAFVSFWLHLVAALVAGFAASYFWTASTILYFLLRRSDDATEFDHIQIPDVDDKDELLPLVGVAASERPVIERPPGQIPPTADAEPLQHDAASHIDAAAPSNDRRE